MINIPKGTKDVLPQDSYKWHYIENIARETANLFGVKEIRTPTFEHTELFLRGVGDTTDIVNKEMYTFEDKGKRSITLKPEGTAGVARAFIENGLVSLPMPLKMYYITPVFRYERPQAGRLREHHQFGIEFYGSKSASIDAEVILLAYTILSKAGLKVKLNINSMGCSECRKEYNAKLKEFFKDNLSNMCPTCKERYEKNPLRILDCKEEGCKKINENAPSILDFLCDECSEHFESLKKYLDVAGLQYEINPKIVRGLDYYTKTVFEFVTTSLGSQGTVCGGGRYDKLVEQIGGSSVPGIGFGMGLERVIMLMEAEGVQIPNDDKVKVFIASMGEKANEKAFELSFKLRSIGVSAETDHIGRSFKSQFKYADKIGAEYVIALGDNEIESQRCKVKNMATGEETEIELQKVLEYNF